MRLSVGWVAAARRPTDLGYKLQHVPASRDGKQRRQAAALHMRCADGRAVVDWKRVAKHACRAQSAAADGKQRQQAAALHMRCAAAGAVADWKLVAKHLCRA